MAVLHIQTVEGTWWQKEIPGEPSTEQVVERFWKQPALDGCIQDVGDPEFTVVTRHVVAFRVER